MLTDDELDFEDDFGDLGDLDGGVAANMTTEELERELQLEFGEVEEEKSKQQVTEHKKDSVIEFDDLDDGEIIETEAQAPAAASGTEKKSSTETTTKQGIKKPESLNNALESPARPQNQRYNKFNNTGFNKNNYYNQQQQFTPEMMAMNGMLPYPQYSNRIYVNPKFAGANNAGGNNMHQQQELLLQQQMQMQMQQQQQRQFMEMETKRLALLQHQRQLLLHKQNTERQNQQRSIDLDQKRRETAEMIRKRRESKSGESGDNHHAGDKRKYDHSTATAKDASEIEREYKRQEVLRKSPAGGISIKGAAAAAAARGIFIPSSPSRTFYTPPQQRSNMSSRIGSAPQQEKLNITSRLNRPRSPPPPPPAPRKEKTTVVPIVTGGKSNTLIVKGFNRDVEDIKSMANSILGGATDIQLDKASQTATILFPSVESAVTFRRKYNRIQMGESHINITFKK